MFHLKGKKGRREPQTIFVVVFTIERRFSWGGGAGAEEAKGPERKAMNREKGKSPFFVELFPGGSRDGRFW